MLKLPGSALPARATALAASRVASGAPEISSRNPPGPPLLRGGVLNPTPNWAVEGAIGASLARGRSPGDARLTSMGAATRGLLAATPASAAVNRLRVPVVPCTAG